MVHEASTKRAASRNPQPNRVLVARFQRKSRRKGIHHVGPGGVGFNRHRHTVTAEPKVVTVTKQRSNINGVFGETPWVFLRVAVHRLKTSSPPYQCTNSCIYPWDFFLGAFRVTSVYLRLRGFCFLWAERQIVVTCDFPVHLWCR